MPQTVDAVILCGGAGRRMQGADKPLSDVHGTPLVRGIRDALAPHVRAVIISANRNLERYAEIADRVVQDRHPDAGPLAGICAAAEGSDAERLLIWPGDAPRVPAMSVAALLGADGPAWLHDGERGQYLHMILSRDEARRLGPAIDAGMRSLREAHELLGAVEVRAGSCSDALPNVNTPADLAAWRATQGEFE